MPRWSRTAGSPADRQVAMIGSQPKTEREAAPN
jgi:hypothetical protein